MGINAKGGNYGKKTENVENETQTVGPGIWRETDKRKKLETHMV